MAKKIKIEVECDRCKKTEEVIENEPFIYDDSPEGWGDIELKKPQDFSLSRIGSSEYMLCESCVKAFGDWWYIK